MRAVSIARFTVSKFMRTLLRDSACISLSWVSLFDLKQELHTYYRMQTQHVDLARREVNCSINIRVKRCAESTMFKHLQASFETCHRPLRHCYYFGSRLCPQPSRRVLPGRSMLIWFVFSTYKSKHTAQLLSGLCSPIMSACSGGQASESARCSRGHNSRCTHHRGSHPAVSHG